MAQVNKIILNRRVRKERREKIEENTISLLFFFALLRAVACNAFAVNFLFVPNVKYNHSITHAAIGTKNQPA
ncbi:hypothetical protein ACFLYO_05220 [Chloroflexota bacterium]